jgi:hypothetical protein
MVPSEGPGVFGHRLCQKLPRPISHSSCIRGVRVSHHCGGDCPLSQGPWWLIPEEAALHVHQCFQRQEVKNTLPETASLIHLLKTT